MRPRWYQTEAKTELFSFLQNNPEPERHPLLALPTGTGKSYIVADISATVVQNWFGMRVLNLTHSSTLIDQNYKRLKSLWHNAPAGVYSAKLGSRESTQPIVFGGIQSVQRNLKDFGHFDLMVTDEAHLTGPDEEKGYMKVFNHLKDINSKIRAVGLSATCFRQGMGMLTEGPLYTDFAYDITGLDAFNRLLDEGFLSPVVPVPTDTEIDLAGVRKTGADYNQKDAEACINTEEITRAAVQETIRLTWDRKHILVFSQGIDHATKIARMFHAYGQDAAVIHSKMSAELQLKVLSAFLSGKLRILVNADMLTTGFDFPGLDCIVMLRATASTSLWVQMLGRGTRPLFASGFDLEDIDQRWAAIIAGGKQNCLVLDFANNSSRLGTINDPKIPKKKGSKPGDAPVKTCKVENVHTEDTPCGAYNYTTATHCVRCKARFVFRPTIVETASKVELVSKRLEPQYEWFDVERVEYKPHVQPNGPSSIFVTYWCTNGRAFNEFVPLENEKAVFLAAKWWRIRFRLKYNAPIPQTVKEAMPYVHLSLVPVQIKVHMNSKYKSVKDWKFKEEMAA